jgi:hypothetical protein
MECSRYIFASAAIYLSMSLQALSQWTPSGSLLDVTVIRRCSMTDGNVAAARLDGFYYCQSRADAIDAQIAGASHFYLVHEYGILAVRKTSRKLADCWAAHKLAAAPNGPHYVRQWIKHWRTYGTADATFGTREQRIDNVRSCCACGA